MGTVKAIVYVLGAALVVSGIVMLFFNTGLAAWMPPGIAIAGVVILVGLFVIGLSERSEERPPPRHHEHHHENDHHHER